MNYRHSVVAVLLLGVTLSLGQLYEGNNETSTSTRQTTRRSEASSTTRLNEDRSTTHRNENHLTTQRNEASSITRLTEGMPTTHRGEASSTTWRNKDSATTRRSEASSSTHRNENHSTTQRNEASSTMRRHDEDKSTTRAAVRRPHDESRPATRALAQSDNHSKAKMKCQEYSRFVKKEVRLPILLPIAPKVNQSNCAIVGQTLIVGGEKAVQKEFAHMAALGYGDEDNIQWLCGGSLISERFILTAAHCTLTRKTGPVNWARLGDINLYSTADDSHAETIPVADRIRHDGYQPPAKYNDIALLRLARDVTISLHIRPACLYTELGNPPNSPNGTASGWGRTAHTDDAGSRELLKVNLALLPEERCNITYRGLIEFGDQLKQGVDPERMICAGYPQADTCSGDSGGPLQIRLKDPYCMYSIIGVTSFGVQGCGLGSPAVYTRISHYITWIEDLVWT